MCFSCKRCFYQWKNNLKKYSNWSCPIQTRRFFQFFRKRCHCRSDQNKVKCADTRRKNNRKAGIVHSKASYYHIERDNSSAEHHGKGNNQHQCIRPEQIAFRKRIRSQYSNQHSKCCRCKHIKKSISIASHQLSCLKYQLISSSVKPCYFKIKPLLFMTQLGSETDSNAQLRIGRKH